MFCTAVLQTCTSHTRTLVIIICLYYICNISLWVEFPAESAPTLFGLLTRGVYRVPPYYFRNKLVSVALYS